MTGHNPQIVGEYLFQKRKEATEMGKNQSFSMLADTIWWEKVPSCPSVSIGSLTAEAYKEELRNNPSKHAQQMLEHIEQGKELGEDPSGD